MIRRRAEAPIARRIAGNGAQYFAERGVFQGALDRSRVPIDPRVPSQGRESYRRSGPSGRPCRSPAPVGANQVTSLITLVVRACSDVVSSFEPASRPIPRASFLGGQPES